MFKKEVNPIINDATKKVVGTSVVYSIFGLPFYKIKITNPFAFGLQEWGGYFGSNF